MPSWIPKINRLFKQEDNSETPAAKKSSETQEGSAEKAAESDTERADDSAKASADEKNAAPDDQSSLSQSAKVQLKPPSRPGSATPPPASLPPPIIPSPSDTRAKSHDSFVSKIPSLASKPPRRSTVPPIPVTRSSLSGNPPSMSLFGQADLEQIKQELVTHYAELKKALDASDQRIQKLEAALEKERDERVRAIEAREQRILTLEKGLKEEQDAWTSQVEERDEALFDLKLELQTELNRVSERVDNQTELVQKLESAAKELREKIDEFQRNLGETRIADVTVGDDLTRIKGVGPRFERALKSQGVTTYEQIAGWTAEDIDRIASQIRVKPERIQREKWVERARELLQVSGK